MAFNMLSDTPGPGHYKPDTYLKKGKIQYSMARKYPDPPLNANPAPGLYKQKGTMDRLKPLSFPRESKADQLIQKA